MYKVIFSQLLDYAPTRSFRKIVSRLDVDHGNQKLSAWEQFICMSFAQLTHCSGLRDIETCLRGMSNKCYHVGLQTRVSKSTLARMNDSRPSIIFKTFCELLIKQARKLYANEKFIEDLNETIYVLDSTYIKLCLSMFPWAQMGGGKKSGLKIHTLLDLNGSIPTFIGVSSAKFPDNKILDEISIEPGAFYVMDKGYVDFKRLNRIDELKGNFVTRIKSNIKFERLYSNPVNSNKGVLLDQIGKLSGSVGKRKYSNKIRKVVFYDSETSKEITFITNNFTLSAETIALLYKKRWQIEIFFKWIKQNLRIKKFYGTSQNAVEIQIWIAIATYMLVVIAKKKLKLNQNLQQILQFLSISLFENMPLDQALTGEPYSEFAKNKNHDPNQLSLF